MIDRLGFRKSLPLGFYMTTLSLTELERKLGPSADFIPNEQSRKYLAQWALAIGREPVEVYSMTLIQLANLYHAKGEEAKSNATELQRLAADIFVRMSQTMQLAKIDPSFIRECFQEEVKKLPAKEIHIITDKQTIVIDGLQHNMTETIIRIASINHPIMMIGPAGCGKTTIGRAVAQALNLPFYITSTISETHELTGFVDGYGVYHRTPFRNAFEFGGVWVPDELDAWDASVLLAANSALANGYSVFPDNPQPINRHPDFRVIATANTFGHGADRVYVGRNELDAATLDRFATVAIDYDIALERMFAAGNIEWLEYVWLVRKEVNARKIRHVVSSRAIIMGSAALRAGIARSDVEEFYVFKGMSSKDRDKIKARLPQGMQQPAPPGKFPPPPQQFPTIDDDDMPF